ncbi:DUF6894 family protein [Sphingomonas oryzagri]
MATYYFHVRVGDDQLLDLEGRALSGYDDVVIAALAEVRALLGSEALEGSINFQQHLDVEDVSGEVVHRLPFIDAVRLLMPQDVQP